MFYFLFIPLYSFFHYIGYMKQKTFEPSRNIVTLFLQLVIYLLSLHALYHKPLHKIKPVGHRLNALKIYTRRDCLFIKSFKIHWDASEKTGYHFQVNIRSFLHDIIPDFKNHPQKLFHKGFSLNTDHLSKKTPSIIQTMVSFCVNTKQINMI